MPEYANVGQTDLNIIFTWTTSLANYTAQVKFFLISAGSSSVQTVSATLSTQTSILTNVTFVNPAIKHSIPDITYPIMIVPLS